MAERRTAAQTEHAKTMQGHAFGRRKAAGTQRVAYVGGSVGRGPLRGNVTPTTLGNAFVASTIMFSDMK